MIVRFIYAGVPDIPAGASLDLGRRASAVRFEFDLEKVRAILLFLPGVPGIELTSLLRLWSLGPPRPVGGVPSLIHQADARPLLMGCIGRAKERFDVDQEDPRAPPPPDLGCQKG